MSSKLSISRFPMASSCYSILLCVFVALFFSSCTATKNSYYFKTLTKDTTISGFVTNNFESKIKPGDNISVVVTSLSKEEDDLFNQAAGEISTVAGNRTPGFLVDSVGNVTFHKIGTMKVAGSTRKELALRVQKAMLPYMKDPIVNVNYLNHKVTILGAVERPQVLNFTEDQVPLLDVLINSGDLTVDGKRNDVIIIREEGDQKKVKHLNLEDNSIFTSPWYYVQPNDIVYVTKDFEKAERTERRQQTQTTITFVVSTVSLLIVILDRLIK